VALDIHGAAFALAENAIAAVSALSGEASPRLRMSSFDSILIRPREAMPYLIDPSWAASLLASGSKPSGSRRSDCRYLARAPDVAVERRPGVRS
jgi:hypothetical protein